MALAILRVHSTNSFKHIFPWTWSFLLDLSSAESSGQACQGPGKFISSRDESTRISNKPTWLYCVTTEAAGIDLMLTKTQMVIFTIINIFYYIYIVKKV